MRIQMEKSFKQYYTRRDFLRTMVGTAAAASNPWILKAMGNLDNPEKPNVIYIFSDEHRWHSMSFTQMPSVHAPNISALAQQGISFNHCVSNYPVCSPHRAILMTGRWPYQQKMTDCGPGMIDNGLPLSSDQNTIGKVFKAAGYSTGYIGKWHLGGTRAEPFGFDMSLIWTETDTHWNSKYWPAGGSSVTCTQYNATAMTDQALQFIEDNKNNPFFLMLSPNPPHAVFTDAPEEKKNLYPSESYLPRRPNCLSSFPTKWWTDYQGYHAHITAIDEEIGRVMNKLDSAGLADNTILIYSSDHGSMMGSQGLGNKRLPYEESIKTPFIARWPNKIPAAATTNVLFGTIDIMPSVCALAGLDVPDTCSGLDFSKIMLGQPGGLEPESQFIMHIYNANGDRWAPFFRGVRTNRYTYAFRVKGEYQEEGPWLLFDNQNDPYQMNNLIDDPSMAAVRKELEGMLSDWLKKANDPFHSDLNGDGKVDFKDFCTLADHWVSDTADLKTVTQRWLRTTGGCL